MKKVKILLITTSDSENIIVKNLGDLHYYPKKYFTQSYLKSHNMQSFHIYITVIDLQEGDWQINHLTNKISIRASGLLEVDARNCSRIIASTDPKLLLSKDTIIKLELSFINEYCNRYPNLPEYVNYKYNRTNSVFTLIKEEFNREEVGIILNDFYEKLFPMAGLEKEREEFIKNI